MLFQALLVVLCSQLLLTSSASASDVVTLTDANFESRMRDYEVALAEFYAPWCGHCKKLAPEYEQAATALKKNDPPVHLVKVDCTVEKQTCEKMGVSGYPTLKIFKNGEMHSDYQGPREAQGIVNYMRTKAGPTVKDILNKADLEKFLSNDQHSIVAYLSSAEGTLAKEFRQVADKLSESYRFAITTVSDLMGDFKDKIVIHQAPRLQSKLEPIQSIFSGEGTIAKWIKDTYHGLVGHRTSMNAGDFIHPLVTVIYNVDYVKDAKGSNYVRNRILKVAKKLREEGLPVGFAISNVDEMSGELRQFGVEDVKSGSKYVIGRDAKNQKYIMETEYSPENLEQFARDLMAGKLEAYLKSEPVPEPTGEAVRTVVARNFDQVVNDESKDVLIEFYAPWCGHCKTLAPKYEELANKLKNEDDIVIAKMDATANDVPSQYDVQGFPTIYYAPKNSKQSPRKYEGGREVQDFIKFLARESTDQLKSYDRSGKKVKGSAKTDL